MEEDSSPKKRPSFSAYQVKEGPEGQSYFNRIGSAFAHKDGEGHTVQLEAFPVDGRIVLRTPQERIKEAKETASSGKRERRPSKDEYER